MTAVFDYKQELQALYDTDGKLTADSVVSKATDPSTALHEHFEWDDTAAAHEYRLEQARHLIRTVRISYQKSERSEPRAIRAYTFVPSADSYVPTPEVVRTEVYRDEAVADIRRALAGMRYKLRLFEEFHGVLEAIDRLLEEDDDN